MSFGKDVQILNSGLQTKHQIKFSTKIMSIKPNIEQELHKPNNEQELYSLLSLFKYEGSTAKTVQKIASL